MICKERRLNFESVKRALNNFPLMKGIKKEIKVTPEMVAAGEGSVMGQTEKEILNDRHNNTKSG